MAKNAILLKHWDSAEIFDRITQHTGTPELRVCVLCHEPSDETAKRRWSDIDDFAFSSGRYSTEYRPPVDYSHSKMKGWPTVSITRKSDASVCGVIHFLWQLTAQREFFKTADVLVIEGDIWQMYKAIRTMLHDMGLD